MKVTLTVICSLVLGALCGLGWQHYYQRKRLVIVLGNKAVFERTFNPVPAKPKIAATYPDCAAVQPVVNEVPGFISISIPPCDPTQSGEWETYTTLPHRFVNLYQEYTATGAATVEGGVKIYYEDYPTKGNEVSITGYWHKADLRNSMYDSHSDSMLIASQGTASFVVFRKPVNGAPPAILVVAHGAINGYGTTPGADIY